MRAVVILASLALSSCLARPTLEPIGGFELVSPSDRSGWSEIEPERLRTWFADAHRALAPVVDYSASLETRERLVDELFPRRVMRLFVGQQPFRVAIETLEPPEEKGQRVWYEPARSKDLQAETPGFLGRLVGTVSLDPEGDLAMKNRRHPITDIGLERLLEQAEERFLPTLAQPHPPRIRGIETTLAERATRLVEALVARPAPDSALVYRFGFDAENGLCVYYGLAELLPDGPALVEEYLYRDVRPNLGLADEVFRPGG